MGTLIGMFIVVFSWVQVVLKDLRHEIGTQTQLGKNESPDGFLDESPDESWGIYGPRF